MAKACAPVYDVCFFIRKPRKKHTMNKSHQSLDLIRSASFISLQAES